MALLAVLRPLLSFSISGNEVQTFINTLLGIVA